MAAPSQIDLIAIVQCQAYVRGFLERRNYKWIKNVRDKRHRTVQEIYSTELTYREGLTHVLEVFKKPLEEDANGPGKMVSKDDIRLMFSEIPVMVLYSNQLVTDLETNVIKNWNDHVKVGTVFLKMLKFFKGYSQYVNVYERARDQIAHLRNTNAKFAAFLREREVSANGVKTPLENYLITPVQRIPRYEMLLHGLVSTTWKTHPDYQSLVEAHKMAATISEQVNDMKRQRENHDKMLQVYNLLTIGKKEHWDKQLLVEKKTRVFVREGAVTESMIKGEQTKFFALLFNDLLLWTKPKKNAYEFKASNDLKNAKVELKTGSGESTIHLRCEGSMRVFKGETEDDTQRWFVALKNCISNTSPEGLQITTSSAQLETRPVKSDKSNPSITVTVADKDRASRLAQDARRKPRGIRSTQLKLTELRFLDDVERSRNERISEQVASIRAWQATPDRADLARFDVTEQVVDSMFHTFGADTYKSFYDMTQSLVALSLHSETPEIVLLGRQGSGKTSLLCSLLGYPLPLEDLRRPLFIHLSTNPAHPPESPSIWIRKDYTQKPRITKDVHVSSPEQLAKELLKRSSKEYSEAPIHLFFEAAHVLNCTIIDTPGLDAFQFHDEPQSATASKHNHLTVRSLVYEVSRQAHRHLFFVEECKHKGLMSSMSGLATVVDPHLTRSRFVFTKFHHELRDMWQHTQLNAYLTSVPHGSFFVTLPSADSLAAAADRTESSRLLAQAYIRDLEILDMLQYDTKFSDQIGIHNLRKYFYNFVHTKHVQSIPRLLEQLNSVTDTTNAQFSTLKPRLAWVEISKLRQVANAFTYDVVKVLPEILFGSTQVEAKVHGHTLQEERYKLDVPHSYWVDNYNQPIIADPEAWSTNIAYHDAKLYGSAQIIRLFSVFNAIVQELQLRQVAKEDIASVVGQSRALHTRDYYLSAAITLAHNKAESTLLPLVKQLCQRAAEMVKRLGAIATHIVGDGALSHGLYKHEMDIPLFAGHVRVLYEHYGTLLSEQCLDECAGVLDQVLIHNVDKYQFELPKDDSEQTQAKVITSLVAAMFNDISRLFVRNVTAKCYDILVARGVEEIGKRLQNDISGLTEADLGKLFDVGSFKMALEAEEKSLKAFDATVKAAHQTFSKAIVIFSDTQHKRVSKTVSFKKLPFDPSLDVQRAPATSSSKKTAKANGSSSSSTSEEKSIKVTTVSKPKREEAADGASKPTNGDSSEKKPAKATGEAASKPAAAAAAAAAAAEAKPVAAPAAEEKPEANNKPTVPAKPEVVVKPAATAPVAEKATAAAPVVEAPASVPVKAPSPGPVGTEGMVKSPSGSRVAAVNVPQKPLAVATSSDPSATPEPLVKPSSKRASVSLTAPVTATGPSPGLLAAKEIIPANNAATKKAAFEKTS